MRCTQSHMGMFSLLFTDNQIKFIDFSYAPSEKKTVTVKENTTRIDFTLKFLPSDKGKESNNSVSEGWYWPKFS